MNKNKKNSRFCKYKKLNIELCLRARWPIERISASEQVLVKDEPDPRIHARVEVAEEQDVRGKDRACKSLIHKNIF